MTNIEVAKARGAAYMVEDRYPGKGAGVFAVRFFTKQLLEVGYYIPDVSLEMRVFDPPRQWAPEFLNQTDNWRDI